jgi:exodeoxyribonuclease VII small subunit
MATKTRQKSFESQLRELEKIVEELEKGELPFEESLKAFEKGIQLYRKCHKALEEGEKKVELLLEAYEENGEEKIQTEPFE